MKKLNKIPYFILAVGILGLTSCGVEIQTTDKEGTTYTPNIVTSVTEGEYSVPSPTTIGDYTVTFICNNGYAYQAKTNAENKVLEPSKPQKECATFEGWYKDEACTSLFTFRNAVTSDITLYAKWDIDYLSLINKLSTECMLANVRINVENYDISGFNRKVNITTSLGSGVIFYEDDGTYYALTNNHVVYKKAKYQDIILEDAYENQYAVMGVKGINTYDLAIVSFKKKDNLAIIPFADYVSNPEEIVFAMGEPEGLSNTVTSGTILGTKRFEPNEDTVDMSNVTFEVYRSTVPISNGSSGGALLDSNLKLIGINFASSVDTLTNKVKYSYAIPIEKVREFVKQVLNIEL